MLSKRQIHYSGKRMERLFVIISVLMLLFTGVPASGEEHKVEKGETALQIAIDHNLTMDQLSQLNPDLDLEMMHVGDILILPDEDSSSFDEFLNKRYGDMLRITDLNCKIAADRSAICLFRAENISELPLYDVRIRASVRDQNGVSGEAEAPIALMQILPGEKLPVYIGIPGSFSTVDHASADIRNLSFSEKLQSSFRINTGLYKQTDTYAPDGISAVSAIDFTPEGISALKDKKINILAAAYDAEGRLTGVRSLYSDFYPRLDITVYSFGDPIRSVEIRMEAY